MTPKSKPADSATYTFEDAPVDERPETPEERDAADVARANFAQTGVALSAEHVTALLNARTK